MMFAVKFKQLLLWEHPATNTVWIGRAMPRVWLVPGGMHNASTAFVLHSTRFSGTLADSTTALGQHELMSALPKQVVPH
jgi:hypothetical protein